MVDVNGYEIQGAIREWKHKRDILENQFDESLLAFDGELKEHPTEVMAQFRRCEANIVWLQLMQSRFNNDVQVELDGEEVPLIRCIKLVGALARQESMWRASAKDASGGRDKYDRVRERSDGDSESEHQVMTVAQLEDEARKAARKTRACRQAIHIGNAQRMTFNVPSELIEI